MAMTAYSDCPSDADDDVGSDIDEYDCDVDANNKILEIFNDEDLEELRRGQGQQAAVAAAAAAARRRRRWRRIVPISLVMAFFLFVMVTVSRKMTTTSLMGGDDHEGATTPNDDVDDDDHNSFGSVVVEDTDNNDNNTALDAEVLAEDVLNAQVPDQHDVEVHDRPDELGVLPVSTVAFDLHTGNERLQRAYRLAKQEFHANIVQDYINDDSAGDHETKEGEPYFIAGNGWTELWTRDTSYAVEQAGGLLTPSVALRSLVKCTTEIPMEEKDDNDTATMTVWYQDECGHFGGWPNLSDAIVGARGAWHLFLYTGNTTFLNFAFDVTVNSLNRAERHVLRNGLFLGCSSFMESNSGYPKSYASNGTLVGQTKALSTNLLYYNGYKLAAEMGKVLLNDKSMKKEELSSSLSENKIQELVEKGRALKDEIRKRFWMEERGYYAYIEDEHDHLIEQMEGLGESLVLLSDGLEDSNHRVRSILDHTHITDIGIPCLWPQFDHGEVPIDDHHIADRYHNGRVWPFVMGYWAIGAARKGRHDIFAKQLLQLMDLSESEDTFAEFYELNKSFPEKRRRQLWSDTGFLAMIIQGLFGLSFQVDGITFAPTKPYPEDFVETYETISLLNINYRQAILDVHVKGFGNRITSFKVNGVTSLPNFKSSLVGKHVIEIEVTNEL